MASVFCYVVLELCVEELCQVLCCVAFWGPVDCILGLFSTGLGVAENPGAGIAFRFYFVGQDWRCIWLVGLCLAYLYFQLFAIKCECHY